MISTKELEYVNAIGKNIRFIPYPGEYYCTEAIKNLEASLKIFDQYYRDQHYMINFSDGSEIDFEITQMNLPHMLGVDTKEIKKYFESLKTEGKKYPAFSNIIDNSGYFSAYNLLKMMSNPQNSDEVLALSKNSCHSIINFYRIMVRCEAFNRFSNFHDMDFGCINYRDESAVKAGISVTSMKSRKFLFVESFEKNAPYFMIGVAIDEPTNKSYIETNFASIYNKDLFTNQTIVLPVSITVESKTSLMRLEASAKQKLGMYRQLRNIVTTYDCYFDIYDDYANNLSRSSSEDAKQRVLKDQGR